MEYATFLFKQQYVFCFINAFLKAVSEIVFRNATKEAEKYEKNIFKFSFKFKLQNYLRFRI